MKPVKLILILNLAFSLLACNHSKESLQVIHTSSYPEKSIILDQSLSLRLLVDTSGTNTQQNNAIILLEEMIARTESIKKNPTDSLWIQLTSKWNDLKTSKIAEWLADSAKKAEAPLILGKWADLNIALLKWSGDAKFGDVLEDLLYQSRRLVLNEKQLKSVIYSQYNDRIYINLIGTSTLVHQHTTGGIVKLIQKTSFPNGNDFILQCECSDVRFLEVFIRIPSWAVNPTVRHGNVKYVARAGEYCQISRKWKDGDEFHIKLKN